MAKHGREKSAKPAAAPARAESPTAPDKTGDPKKSAKPKKDLLRPPSRRRAAKETVEIAGLVADVFGRRFTLEADGARTLVDLGRRGAALVSVAPGARLVILGRRKNGEVKAWALRDSAEGRARVLRKEKRVKTLETPAGAALAEKPADPAPARAAAPAPAVSDA